MATLNMSSNGPSINNSYQSVINSQWPSSGAAKSPTYGQWAVFSVSAPLLSSFQQEAGKESMMKVQSTGEGELVDLVEEFSDGRIQFAFVKVKDPNTSLPKYILIAWCGEGVPERTKGYFSSHLDAVTKIFHGYHVQVIARSEQDIIPESMLQKVANASGSKYSGGGQSSSHPTPPPAPIASKPVFLPTRVGGTGIIPKPQPSSSRPLASNDQHVDADGWGSDAPPVTRTQLEKVDSAYRPTKVDLRNLTGGNQDASRSSQGPRDDRANDGIVRGAYQPVGKVDIAALRQQAKESGSQSDDRPVAVKGSYEPVGKVDIAAIRAKAGGSQGPREQLPQQSAAADGMSAPSQPERLTTLPKPKVASRFGSSTGAFTGTTPQTPGDAATNKPAGPATQVGSASRTFADEGGKTPAQIWADRKARQQGSISSIEGQRPGPSSITSPIQSQRSGGGGSSGGGADDGWKSSYTGKSWAPVHTTRTGQSAGSNTTDPAHAHEPDGPGSPTGGGLDSIRDRFEDSGPAGASSLPPPLMHLASKPNASARGGVAIPGLQTRQPQQQPDSQVPAEEHFSLPEPPRQPRSPSPETPPPVERPGSPIRIAMPVSRGRDAALQPPEERFSPPPVPTASVADALAAHQQDGLEPEPLVQQADPARRAAETTAAATFGGTGTGAGAEPGHGDGGRRALVQYDYEKAEGNEINLREGEYVTHIDMVDDDWWMGRNGEGETGLFPSNYVELVEDDGGAGHPSAEQSGGAGVAAAHSAAREPEHEHEHGHGAATAAPAANGKTATALYDYEAAEENELSFPEGAKITGVDFPDEDWWSGSYGGKEGLFPANYVGLDD